ncbi:MAG: hypothetical protein R3C01_16140 [Planctomycetaceae bacterium]
MPYRHEGKAQGVPTVVRIADQRAESVGHTAFPEEMRTGWKSMPLRSTTEQTA